MSLQFGTSSVHEPSPGSYLLIPDSEQLCFSRPFQIVQQR
jgi:hypothetical protein